MLDIKLDNLKIDDIDNDGQRELAELIGIDAYIILIKNYGGSSIYISKKDSYIKNIRDNMIKKEFRGDNHLYLAKKYNLSVRSIQEIVSNRVFDGQIDFDDILKKTV